MPTINGILDIGRQSLFAQQQNIQVTGDNIANVNTPGYTRRRTNLVTSPQLDDPSIGQIGTGVTATHVARVFDRFIGGQINDAAGDLGRWEAQENSLSRVEMVFNESQGYGLNQAMSDFWNAWQDLANNPSGASERAVLTAKSSYLSDTFQKMRSDLSSVQQDVDIQIAGTVADINTMSTRLTELNTEIVNIEKNGQHANAQRDQRDTLLRDMGELISFTSTESADGRVTVTLDDGNQLVGISPFGQLTTVTNAATGLSDIAWDTAPGAPVNATITSGKLKGWLDTRDTIVAGAIGQMDALAGDMITRVNTQHAAGFDLTGGAGVNFFTGTSAADMAVNSVVSADPRRIAAASDLGGLPGGGGNAIALANLQYSATMSSGSATYDDYYNGLVSTVGIEKAKASNYRSYQESTLSQLANYRDSISGVSIDEEMVKLVEFEHAYNAAAKLISTVDQMLDTLLKM
ncbi:MAG: flagellar hook-associated protein FlgK [Pseudomonadota bacterium]